MGLAGQVDNWAGADGPHTVQWTVHTAHCTVHCTALLHCTVLPLPVPLWRGLLQPSAVQSGAVVMVETAEAAAIPTARFCECLVVAHNF